MKRFFIVTNMDKDKDFLVTQRILDFFLDRGCETEVWKSYGRREGSWHYVDPQAIPAGTECIIVLGGDGTLLQTARDTVRRGIPLLGVNLGHLGFLAELGATEIETSLEKLLKDEVVLEERMMLQGNVYRGDLWLGGDIALNDIVITREGRIRVIPFRNYVNGVFLNSFNADGVIISTATGSTGYSLSAGGPIVSPSANLAIMTALAPHTLNMRTVVFPPQDLITVEIGDGRHGSQEQTVVSFDGDTEIKMLSKDRIVIERANVSTTIVKLSNLSFLAALRQKLGDNQ